jgi:hypothetical protein
MEIWSLRIKNCSASRHSRCWDRSPICTRTFGARHSAVWHCVQVSVARLNVTENMTIYIDRVQRFNYSVANGSISFISPESAANNSYARILVSDAMGIEHVTPDRLYYSDKVRASTARQSRFGRHEIRIRLVVSVCSAKALGTMGPAWTASRVQRSSSVFTSAPPLFGCIFNGVSTCRVRFVPEATVAGPGQDTGTKEMYAFLPQSRRARWRFVRSSLGLQDDPQVVPCDPPAEERCRGVNNTDAAPRIIDSCPDPLDRARCYTVHSENGCGEVYYAGLPPIVAQIMCSMCTVLNSTVTFRYLVWFVRRWVLREGEELCPVQPSVAAHHVSPAWRFLLGNARSMASFRQDHRREHFPRPLQPACILCERRRRFGCMGRRK